MCGAVPWTVSRPIASLAQGLPHGSATVYWGEPPPGPALPACYRELRSATKLHRDQLPYQQPVPRGRDVKLSRSPVSSSPFDLVFPHPELLLDWTQRTLFCVRPILVPGCLDSSRTTMTITIKVSQIIGGSPADWSLSSHPASSHDSAL